MLLSQKTLDAVVKGEIDRVYRRWKRPAVVEGTLQRTSHGLVEVIGLRRVEENEIEPIAAGFDTTEEVLADVRPPEPGTELYEVRVRWAGDDHRLALRESTDLDDAALEAIDSVVSGIGRHGRPTGIELLQVIAANPATLAKELADGIGVERDVLKRRVRQLKEIGLTESLRIGYRLSPRGEAYLARRSQRP
ncbi:MAG: hypothetical protein WEF28_07945 [Acidimicrobiia bacterium]